MRKTDVLLKIKRFEKALERLLEATNIAKTELEKDGVIQRFEFTIELLWKTLKVILKHQGIECFSPKGCVKEAFKVGIIKDDEIILDMLEDRNKSSHLYDEKESEQIFIRIKEVYLDYLKSLDLKNKV